jgi:hypothetical protein
MEAIFLNHENATAIVAEMTQSYPPIVQYVLMTLAKNSLVQAGLLVSVCTWVMWQVYYRGLDLAKYVTVTIAALFIRRLTVDTNDNYGRSFTYAYEQHMRGLDWHMQNSATPVPKIAGGFLFMAGHLCHMSRVEPIAISVSSNNGSAGATLTVTVFGIFTNTQWKRFCRTVRQMTRPAVVEHVEVNRVDVDTVVPLGKGPVQVLAAYRALHGRELGKTRMSRLHFTAKTPGLASDGYFFVRASDYFPESTLPVTRNLTMFHEALRTGLSNPIAASMRSVLVYGPPGTGKTSYAAMIAAFLGRSTTVDVSALEVHEFMQWSSRALWCDEHVVVVINEVDRAMPSQLVKEDGTVVRNESNYLALITLLEERACAGQITFMTTNVEPATFDSRFLDRARLRCRIGQLDYDYVHAILSVGYPKAKSLTAIAKKVVKHKLSMRELIAAVNMHNQEDPYATDPVIDFPTIVAERGTRLA